MGNQLEPIQYSVAVKKLDPEAGETPIYRHKDFIKGKLLTSTDKSVKTLQDVLINSVKTHSNANHLGTREKFPDSYGHYIFKTYKECFNISKLIGSGLINMELVPIIAEYSTYKMKMIGIFSQNQEEWYLMIWAAVMYGITIVPFYATLGPDNISYVLRHTNVTTLCLTPDKIDQIAQFKQEGQAGSLDTIIIFGKASESDLAKLEKVGLKVYNMNQIMNEGQKQIQEKAKVHKDDIYSFCYTSGTTGTPKAALLSHGNIVATIASLALMMPLKIGDSYISYLPIPHIYEGLTYWVMLTYGSKVGMYSGDIKKIKFDIQELKPTLFPSVPRLLNKIFDGMQMKIGQLKGVQKYVVNKAIKHKLKKYNKNGKTTSFKYDFLAMNKFKNAFGGKLRLILSGSAPINGDTLNFLRVAFSCKVIEGYGQTENTGLATFTSPKDNKNGHVGGIIPSLEMKLVDIPEMKYFSTDKSKKGVWLPRGEICLRGPAVFKGYYKNIEKTAETIDNDGWLYTGDVGQILENGSLKVINPLLNIYHIPKKIIDRKKNIFKLQQGEYIAPEKIENIYGQSPVIEEIFVHGDSLQSYLIAIIVPEKTTFLELVKQTLNYTSDNETYEELCANPEVATMLVKHLEEEAIKGKLFGFEKIRAIHISPISFGEYDLLTTTFKLKRNAAKEFFKDVLDKMYQKK